MFSRRISDWELCELVESLRRLQGHEIRGRVKAIMV